MPLTLRPMQSPFCSASETGRHAAAVWALAPPPGSWPTLGTVPDLFEPRSPRL